MNNAATITESMSINFCHERLERVRVRGEWMSPAEAIEALSSGRRWIGDVDRVQLRDSDVSSWAVAWQSSAIVAGVKRYDMPTGLMIGAGANGNMTVLRAGAL